MARHVDRRLWCPPQLTMSLLGIAGFWVAELRPGMSVERPHIAIGVHPDGDWHAAVDYYVESIVNKAGSFPYSRTVPEQAAIYPIQVAAPAGCISPTSKPPERHWDSLAGDVAEWGQYHPPRVSAPAGALLAVVMRREKRRTCSSSTTGVRSGGHRCATARGVRPSR
jgi:hypothetical protein